jgi:hypothetical protein
LGERAGVRASVSLPSRIVRQFHNVVEIGGGVIAPNLQNVHQTVVGAGDGFELLQSSELALEMLDALEGLAVDDLHRAQSPDGTARQPDFAIAPLADTADQLVIVNVRRRFRRAW